MHFNHFWSSVPPFMSRIHAFSGPVLWTKCSPLLIQMSSKSPGSIQCSPECVDLNAANASQSQRICYAISNAHFHLPHPGMSTSPSSNRCPLNWQCPVTNPTIILRWFLIIPSNPPNFVCKGPLTHSSTQPSVRRAEPSKPLLLILAFCQ